MDIQREEWQITLLKGIVLLFLNFRGFNHKPRLLQYADSFYGDP